MKAPHPIPYQGSKRLLAPAILAYFPKNPVRLIEPFAGAAGVSIAASLLGRADRFLLNDINEPLMRLWEIIIESPDTIALGYERLWKAQLGKPREYYDAIRAKFNQTHEPDSLLYLLARCVKASVRYNSVGEFNQSPDNRRLGMNPATMLWHISAASRLLKGKVKITAGDYRQCLELAQPQDVVYMDPPYQGVCLNRDPRYISLLDFDSFTESLRDLNGRHISFILSYDGKTGAKTYGRPMPDDVRLTHIEIDAGRSSQATLLGRDHTTYESLYLSPALIERIDSISKRHLTVTPKQFSLLPQNDRAEPVQRIP
ncbi:MAG: DNA adenine methylase [Terriglobia bacterium]